MARPLPTSLALLLVSVPAVLASCSSTGTGSGTPPPVAAGDNSPGIEERERELRAADAKRSEFSRVLLQLDVLLDSYVRAVNASGNLKADEELARIEKGLRDLVSGKPAGTNTSKLLATAADASERLQRGTALAALGFASNANVMPVILAGAQLEDEFLVDRAILGLAVLHDPKTPPGVIGAVVEDPKHNENGRINAAWALFTLQKSSERTDEIAAIWRRVLEQGEAHPTVLMQAVRGLGLLRGQATAADRALAARYASHPVAKVREAAAIALGRMNAQDQYEKLLDLIGPAESIANVRLAARKALQALAGGIDRGYDVELWRKEFQRTAPTTGR